MNDITRIGLAGTGSSVVARLFYPSYVYWEALTAQALTGRRLNPYLSLNPYVYIFKINS